MVKPGRCIARIAKPLVPVQHGLELLVELAFEAAEETSAFACSPTARPSSCRRMNLAQKSGTTVIAKKYDAKIESTTPSASGVKMYLLTPLKEGDREKHDGGGEGGGQHGHRDFRAALLCGLARATRPSPCGGRCFRAR